MALGLNHGHPDDLPSSYLTDGWSYFRFNGFWGPYKGPSDTAAQRLLDIHATTGNKSIVTMLYRPFPLGLSFEDAVESGALSYPLELLKSQIEYLQRKGLTRAVIADVFNGPERPVFTSYRGHLPTSVAARTWAEKLFLSARSMLEGAGIEVMSVADRHLYIHRDNSPRDFWEDSMTGDVMSSTYWCTECMVHTSLGADRANTLAFLLDTALWNAERKYIHAPYQMSDPAGYGGAWYDMALKSVIQARM